MLGGFPLESEQEKEVRLLALGCEQFPISTRNKRAGEIRMTRETRGTRDTRGAPSVACLPSPV